ncbi:hypothetical protein LCGC14_2825560 [marine sediment metagenome]|uniref:Uncharacterized protein n=1 Tax=marine sediment metagenome TaxID=412755 RepID=A0A0F9B6T6_9ZZZZ
MFNLWPELGKYICIHCKNDFKKIPLSKNNECRTAYKHYIVEKSKLKKIEIKRDEKCVW